MEARRHRPDALPSPVTTAVLRWRRLGAATQRSGRRSTTLPRPPPPQPLGGVLRHYLGRLRHNQATIAAFSGTIGTVSAHTRITNRCRSASAAVVGCSELCSPSICALLSFMWASVAGLQQAQSQTAQQQCGQHGKQRGDHRAQWRRRPRRSRLLQRRIQRAIHAQRRARGEGGTWAGAAQCRATVASRDPGRRLCPQGSDTGCTRGPSQWGTQTGVGPSWRG